MNNALPATTRVALVTTLRGAERVLESFVHYHLGVGFSCLYLFFDDADDPGLAIARRLNDSRIAILVRGAELDAEWRKCIQFGYYAPHVAHEVMARQSLNAEVAVQRALADQIDWLLHIDADELFHCPGQDAPTHFSSLAAQGVERAIYPNFEALCESETVGDFFRDVTLFKFNPNLQPGGRLSAAQQAATDASSKFPPHFFLFYSNGKSAARVRPGLVPDGVHRFHARQYPRAGQTVVTAPTPTNERVIGDCRILHYACCGFDTFLEKYRTLGAFADKWFGNVDIRSSIGAFHLAARDVVATGDREAALHFYRQFVMIDDPVTIETLIRCGLLLRITGPAESLRTRGDGSDHEKLAHRS
ncbi:MAG: glycosyltransferase family 2 protein [Betaproteobacteria bacterium]